MSKKNRGQAAGKPFVKRPVSRSGKSSTPRILAAKLLSEWQGLKAGRRPALNRLLQEYASRLPSAAAEDRALLGEIVTGSIRWLRLLAALTETRLKKPEKIPPIIKSILITATYQIMFLDRIPPFAAVNEAVKAVRACKAAWASGLVNAVLRTILRDMEKRGRDALINETAAGAGSAAERIAITMSYPTWMVKRWFEHYGAETAVQICRAGNSRPPVVIRVNRLKTSRDHAVEMLEQAGILAVRSKISPDGLILPGFRGNPVTIPGFEAGIFQVQDESAQLVSLLLQCGQGERILDACAGLGGKTTHIAEITRDAASIEAWDTSSQRLGLLEENVRRLGLSSIRVLKEEEFQSISRAGQPVYHRIMVDAPCSGLGVIRRHPDIKWNRNPDDSTRLAETQISILQQAAPLLKQGGTMVYAVCTTEPEETVGVVQRFLQRHDAWQTVSVNTILPALENSLVTEEGYLRILPMEQGPDGFFAAVFERII